MPNKSYARAQKNTPICPLDFHTHLCLGLARAAAKLGRGTLADSSGRTHRSLNELTGGNSLDTKSGKGLLDFLHADPTALDEVLSLYGFGLHILPGASLPGDEVAEAKALVELTHAQLDAMSEGKRDHRKVISIGDKARPVAMACYRMISEADDARKGVAV